MTPEEAMQAIETDRFAAEANIASSYSLFRSVVRSQPEFRVLREALASDSSRALKVALRTLDLDREQAVAGYEHPHDTALAVYLILLSDNPRFRQGAAALAASMDFPEGIFCWARKAAEDSAKRPAPAPRIVRSPLVRNGFRAETRTPRGLTHHMPDPLAPLFVPPGLFPSRGDGPVFGQKVGGRPLQRMGSGQMTPPPFVANVREGVS